MILWIAEFVFYAALVGAATRLSWHCASAFVGVTLCACLLVSEAAYFGTSFPARLTIEAIQAVAIINAARVAFRVDHCPSHAIVVLVYLADLAFVTLLAAHVLGKDWRGHSYGVVTNALFAAACLCVAYPGVRDAVYRRRADRRSGGLVGRGRPAPNAKINSGREA